LSESNAAQRPAIELAIGDRRRRRIALADRQCPGRGTDCRTLSVLRRVSCWRPEKPGGNSVRLSDGTVLNRYWDARDAPRDESFKEDAETAADSGRPPTLVYRNLRAATESGWDFSSRWLTDGKTLGTVRTLSILPVDINGLLVHLEQRCPILTGPKEMPRRRRPFRRGR
jgi:hypothetical protein